MLTSIVQASPEDTQPVRTSCGNRDHEKLFPVAGQHRFRQQLKNFLLPDPQPLHFQFHLHFHLPYDDHMMMMSL